MFVLHLQIAFIYPFEGCVDWWGDCFESRRVWQIGSCNYDGWENGMGKNGYTKIQVGFKIVPCLLERLIREDNKKYIDIYEKLAQKQ